MTQVVLPFTYSSPTSIGILSSPRQSLLFTDILNRVYAHPLGRLTIVARYVNVTIARSAIPSRWPWRVPRRRGSRRRSTVLTLPPWCFQCLAQRLLLDELE